MITPAEFVDIVDRTSRLCSGPRASRRSREPPLELGDALRASDCPASVIDSVTLIQADQVEAVERRLEGVADVIGKWARPFLAGDQGSFDAARAIRADRARTYTAQVVDAPAIAEADSAWQTRDYEVVSHILGPIRDRLDDMHRRRLVFAESNVERGRA